MKAVARRKVIRALPKGQITIPGEFRKALGIGPETLLSVSLVKGHLEISLLDQHADGLRRYTAGDIERFLAEDRLDQETVRKVRALIGRRKL